MPTSFVLFCSGFVCIKSLFRDVRFVAFVGRPNKTFGHPNKIFGRPNKIFGRPNKIFGRPNKIFGRPNKTFGHPNKTFGRPNKTFGPCMTLTIYECMNFCMASKQGRFRDLE